MRKTLLPCMIGNIIEWYEFMLYGYFATVIGTLFFPPMEGLYPLVFSFAIFSVGLFVRPIGGIVLGHIGDKLGRKKSLILSVYMMALPTAAIGLLPTYATIGALAPILLVCMRILQGFAMGGEYAGTVVSILEHSPNKKRGLYGSLAALSLVSGMLLGSIAGASCEAFLSQEELYTWGWRIPFFLGLVGAIWGMYMRRSLEETGKYLDCKNENRLSRLPIGELFQNFLKIVQAVLVQTTLAVGIYTITIFYINFAKTIFEFTSQGTFFINALGTVILGLSTVLFGKLSDVYGRKKVMLLSTISIMVVAYPCISLTIEGNVQAYMTGYLTLSFLVGGVLGPLPTFLVEFFNTNVRYSAVALTNNLSMGIFGGTAPVAIAYLIQVTGTNIVPAFYLMGTAVITILALLSTRDDYGRELA
ncbi:MAG: MFS transporter [Alphaproteobacteria bacterium]|nr:MFS transporter [Alphaproteobacteria bacterium]